MSGPSLFMIPSAGTTPLSLISLARATSPPINFFSFEPTGLYVDQAPHENIEEIACAYVSEITDRQEQGPYYIAGHCFGGTVAFEIARQIEKEGGTVAGLILLDSIAHPQNSSNHQVDEKILLEVEKMVNTVKERTVHQLNLLPEEIAERLKIITHSYINAGLKFTSGPIFSKIILIRSENCSDQILRGWHNLTKNSVDEFGVSGDTFSMLQRPHAENLGKLIGTIVHKIR